MTPLESIYAEPEKWHVDSHYFIHEDGFRLWVHSGGQFVHVTAGGKLGIIERWRYWQAFKWWRKNAPITAYTS